MQSAFSTIFRSNRYYSGLIKENLLLWEINAINNYVDSACQICMKQISIADSLNSSNIVVYPNGQSLRVLSLGASVLGSFKYQL